MTVDEAINHAAFIAAFGVILPTAVIILLSQFISKK